ncbi:MAG: LON peptidase substrate-binding domain-containing protein [Polyangiales bacterium]
MATTPPPPPSGTGKPPPVSFPRDLRPAMRELPIFPLPQAVLFPGALMPLHIFEPRYRKMTRDALDTHGAIAIAHIIEGSPIDEHGHPAISLVAGVGLIVESQELPDGRFNVLLEGRARVHLTELPFVPAYRRARGELLEDTHVDIQATDLQSLVAIANAFTVFVQARDPNFQFSLPPSLPGGRIADLCAHHLILDAKERQKVLETLDPAARVRMVADALAVQLSVFKRESRATMN